MSNKMSSRKKCILIGSLFLLTFPMAPMAKEKITPPPLLTPYTPSLTEYIIAEQLGWVSSDNLCGGYFVETPIVFPIKPTKRNLVEITSKEPVIYSQQSTSIFQGKVTVTREGQELTANKAYLYRDPATGKLNAVDLIGDVKLHEPNTLVHGDKGYFNFQTKTKTLSHALYRSSAQLTPAGRIFFPKKDAPNPSPISTWGSAAEFSQTKPNIYDFVDASYTTCPPISPTWQVKSRHLVLDKNTGRGYATHARVLLKGIPVFYTPYINFPIDFQRKTGFLWPTAGTSNKWGPYVRAPFYWNMAPNYDMTITPAVMEKRGVQLSDTFRYLSSSSLGSLNLTVIPYDREFAAMQSNYQEKFHASLDPLTQAELNRLVSASPTRGALWWRDKSRFNENWSAEIDFNYASDDYYLQDFGTELNEITQNQLLELAEIHYSGQYWNFLTRLQGYETLHPLTDTGPTAIQNQYRRLPQFVLDIDYPDQALGLEYTLSNDLTHFELLQTPGVATAQPIGTRINTQPAVSLPLNWPYFHINPRVQLALTGYQLADIAPTSTPRNIGRAVPIFDVLSGFAFVREAKLFNYAFQQTFEPQFYYTYIPYRDQSDIPIFDTTVNTLNYDQLFVYNRFSGLDRIGDTNQLSVGLTTRFIEQQTGIEKARLGIGEIVYFANRRVTLCNNDSCVDNPSNPDNRRRLSPLSGIFNYNVNAWWNIAGTAIWNPETKALNNAVVGFHLSPYRKSSINLGYNFVNNSNIQSGISQNTSANNVQLTDLSVVLPVTERLTALGRWVQDLNKDHFQNLIYGVQYENCCWAIQAMAGRAFTNINATNTYQYNSEFFIQFALKGLGNFGAGSSSALLNSISGYEVPYT